MPKTAEPTPWDRFFRGHTLALDTSEVKKMLEHARQTREMLVAMGPTTALAVQWLDGVIKTLESLSPLLTDQDLLRDIPVWTGPV